MEVVDSDWVPTRCSPPSEGSPAPMTGSRYNKPAGGTWHISRRKNTHHLLQKGNSAKLLSEVLFEQTFFFRIWSIFCQEMHQICIGLPDPHQVQNIKWLFENHDSTVEAAKAITWCSSEMKPMDRLVGMLMLVYQNPYITG